MAKSSSSTNKHTSHSYILISFSNANLLEQQKNFFLIKKAQSNTLKAITIKNKYEAECRQFFNTIDKKHASQRDKFKLFTLNEPHSSIPLLKVQFLKLCSLDKINEILSLTAATATNANNDVQFKEIANDYVKNATHEILLSTNGPEETHAQSVIKFRQDSPVTNTTISSLTTTTISTNLTNNETASESSSSSSSFLNSIFISKEKLLDMFWSVVPREDLLLAVIVPLTIICSMCILTIVVACLLHMFNRNYKENKKKLILLNTTTTSSNSCNSGSTNTNNKVVASSSCTSSDSTKLGKLFANYFFVFYLSFGKIVLPLSYSGFLHLRSKS